MFKFDFLWLWYFLLVVGCGVVLSFWTTAALVLAWKMFS